MARRPVFPSPDSVRMLPVHFSMTVPREWQDRNGHVNVQYYQRLYELGGYAVLDEIGYDLSRCEADDFGMFDLEHHLHYRAELLVGHRVSCYNRLLTVEAKRFHGMYFVVNDTTGLLACTLEYITCGVDLRTRRTVPLPEPLRDGLVALIGGYPAFGWQAPVCGVMSP